MTRRPGPASPAQLDTSPFPALHRAADLPPPVVAAHVRTGAWVRVRRGFYVDGEAVRGDDGRRRLALAHTLAAHGCLGPGHVVSHASAALVAGLSLLTVPTQVHVTHAWRPRSAVAPDVVRHVRHLPDGHVTTIGGLPATTPARTLADCATSLRPLDALVVLDSGLHVGVDRAEIEGIVRDLAGRRGIVQARALLGLADDGAESPGETWTRWVLLRAGLPLPETQVEVVTRAGTYWADLGWREWRLLVEYDGRAKYAGPGGAMEILLAERRRQEAIEAEGWRVVRVLKEDLRTPHRLVDRVLRWVPPGSRQLDPRRFLAA